MDKEVDILIIGGGVTGISLASFLNTSDYLIIEKDSELGGYCKTSISKDFIWDYSGHFFHFNNNEIKNYLVDKMDCEVITVNKVCYVYYNKKLIDFPFQNNIHQLEESEYLNCLKDLKTKEEFPINTFTDYVVSNLGKAICNKFIIPYNQKLYACDLDLLDFDAMGRFFPKSLDYNDIIKNTSFKSKQTTYNDTFIYPKGGSFEFIKSLLKRVNSNNIIVNNEVYNIDIKEKKVSTSKGIIKYNKLVNTIPFNHLLKLSGEESQNLSWNKVVVFNMGFDSPSDIDANWIYYPGDEIFYRVGFYNNIFKTDKMSLYVEIGMKNNEVYDEKVILNLILKDLQEVGVLKNQKLIDYQVICMNPAYVHITKESKSIYNRWCEKNNTKDVFSIGRYGSWTYCSIEDNIIQAKELALKLNKQL
jgi:protoporphyrinogen oxidase